MIRETHEKMVTCRLNPVQNPIKSYADGGKTVADVKIEDGIIKVTELDVQDPKVAKILEEYPPNRWCEITRRAIKIGLGYLQGGARD